MDDPVLSVLEDARERPWGLSATDIPLQLMVAQKLAVARAVNTFAKARALAQEVVRLANLHGDLVPHTLADDAESLLAAMEGK
jgi:hypothetical protein